MLSLTTIVVKANCVVYKRIVPWHSMGTALKRQAFPNRGLGREPAQANEMISLMQGEKLELGALNGHLGYFLRRLQVALFKDFIRTLAPMKLRPAEYSVLILVDANPGRSQATIGRALGIERARLARLLHKLERRKWIQRRSAAGDGRSHSLFLTAEGDKTLLRIKNLTERYETHMAELVGQKRRVLLMGLLKDFG